MSYLEDYIEKVSNLPNDVNRYLRLIKELDIRLSNATIKQDDLQEQYLQQLKNSKDKKGDQKKLESEKIKIERLQKECLSLSQEKMAIADQLYQSIDDSIKELEHNLKQFESELKVESTPQPPEKENISSKKKKKYDQKLMNKIKEQRKQERQLNQQLIKEKVIASNEWKQHPDEPRYCYCNKVSYGEMYFIQSDIPQSISISNQFYFRVKCDNNFCDQEWFHFECVGLTNHPKGKWFCKNCQQHKKSKLIN